MNNTSLPERIQAALTLGWQMALSVVKILAYSKMKVRAPQTLAHKELVILGNGPSLRKVMEQNRSFLTDKDLLFVNFSVLSDYYEEVAPSFYLLMDPAFFSNPDSCEKVFAPMIRKTSWEMQLFAPYSAKKHSKWQQMLAENNHIHISFFNATPVEGYNWFTHFCYTKGWGMPRPRNVLVACLMVALRIPFQTIYLAGADHSWMKEIWVDDNNVVNEDRAHFYDKKGTSLVVSPYKLHQLLESMCIAFKSYHAVQAYCSMRGKRIINITDGSYIDAFPRQNID